MGSRGHKKGLVEGRGGSEGMTDLSLGLQNHLCRETALALGQTHPFVLTDLILHS